MADGRIEFTAQGQSPIEIRYRLPKQLTPPIFKGNAELSVLDASNPAGPVSVLLPYRRRLLFAALIRKSGEPIRSRSPRGFRQSAAGGRKRQRANRPLRSRFETRRAR